jgi:RNA polymerase subunit RPABC4/transcription elongation factor Spt4
VQAGGPLIGSDTWTCKACGAETPTDKAFCQICGTPEPPTETGTVIAPAQTETPTLRTSSPTGSAACAHCGTLLAVGSQFCNACGAPIPSVDERLHCAACGQELPEGAAFCNVCGAAAPQLPPTPPPDDPSATGGGHSRSRLWVLIAAIVCVVAAAAVAGVLFLPDLLDSGPEPPTLTEQVAKVMPAVVQANADFRAAVKDIRPNGPNVISQTREKLRVCDQQGRALRAALKDASATLTAAPAEDAEPATQAETAAKTALLDAFKANKGFVQSIQSLPADPLRLTKGMVSQCRKAAQETSRAYEEATSSFAALQPPYQLPEVALTGGVTTRLQLTATRMGKEREFIAYLENVNGTLTGARDGRIDVSAAVDGTADDCRIEPNEALGIIESALANRQSVLSSAHALSVPNDERARAIQDALTESYQYSVNADISYKQWIGEVAEYYYQDPVGLLPGYDPTDEQYYDEGNALSDSAGSAKSRLCQLLNRWNQKYDIGDSWSATEI